MEDWKDKEISLILPTFNEKNSIRKVIDNFSKLELCIDTIYNLNNVLFFTLRIMFGYVYIRIK